MDFVDRNVGEGDPVRPLPLEDTPFKLVDEVNGLKELCAKLQDANEFAVSFNCFSSINVCSDLICIQCKLFWIAFHH